MSQHPVIKLKAAAVRPFLNHMSMYLVHLVVALVEHHVVHISFVGFSNDGLISNHMVLSRHFWQLEHGAPVKSVLSRQLDAIGLDHPLKSIGRFLVEPMRRLE